MFSIIIPVHNGENYIKRCLDSILAQTFSDFEIIIVENNSIDRSRAILESYLNLDKRIKLFFSVVSGASNARNIGLDNASGDIVCFVDIDDTISPDYLENIANTFAIYPEASAIIFNYNIVKTNLRIDKPCHLPSIPVISGKAACALLFDGDAKVYGYICNKAIRVSSISGRRFDVSLTMAEDLDFFSKLLYTIDCVAILNKPLYFYWENKDSASSQSFIRDSFIMKESRQSDDLIRCYRSLYEHFSALEGMRNCITENVFSNYAYFLSKYCFSIWLENGKIDESPFFRDFIVMKTVFKKYYAKSQKKKYIIISFVSAVIQHDFLLCFIRSLVKR